jgi:tape measure domain-containing protein
MADGSADFTLRLNNQVTGPARAMSRSIRGLSDDLRDKQRIFDQGESAFQKKLKASRRMADTTHRQELRAMQKKREATQRAAAADTKSRLGAQRARLQERFAGVMRHKQTQARNLRRSQARGARNDTAGRSTAVGALATIAGVSAVAAAAVGFVAAKFTSATMAAIDFGQRSKTALTSILKDGPLAAQQFSEVRKEAGGLGLDVVETVDQFKMLANSGFKVPMARELVRMSADLQALTGSSESAEFALRAISQIKMKGRLQAEEITGQLAEHGVSADEVYKVLGKTLGKTRQEILKMQKAGDLSADVAIPAILQAVRNQLGVEQSGGFAMKINSSSVGGMWRTLKGQVENAFISLGEEVGPGVTAAFSSIMASIQSAVAGPQVAALGKAVVELFNAASAFVQQTDIAGLLSEAAKSLGTEIQAAAVFIRDHGAELRESFVRFAVAMGTGLQMAADFFKPFIALASSDFAKFMFTPLNETFGDGDAVKESQARMAAASRSTNSATQAGSVAAGGHKYGDIKFGDINVALGDHDGTPEGAAGAIVSGIRGQMMRMLEDGT